MNRAVVILLLLGTPSIAVAQNVSVQVTPGADAQRAADVLGTSLSEFEGLLADQIADSLGLLDTEGYLQPFADAQAFSSRGLTADYASEFDFLLVGIGAAGAFAIDDDIDPDNLDRAIDGVAPAINALVGLDMSVVGLDGLRVFLSGFRRSDNFGEADEFDVEVDNLGLHGQLRLFGGEGDSTSEYFWDWRGLDITAGLNRASTTLTLTQELPTALSFSTQGGELPVDLASTGILELEATAITIPLELTTAITILSFATVYGGFGTDIQLGDATIRAQLSGDLTGDTGSDTLDVGTATINADESADPSRGRWRALAGLQIQVWLLKAFVQGNYMPGVAASAAGGIKLAF